MMMSDMNLKSYSDTSYHSEELKSLTRYRFDKVKEWAKLKSSVAWLVNILFPELESLVPQLYMNSVYALLSERFREWRVLVSRLKADRRLGDRKQPSKKKLKNKKKTAVGQEDRPAVFAKVNNWGRESLSGSYSEDGKKEEVTLETRKVHKRRIRLKEEVKITTDEEVSAVVRPSIFMETETAELDRDYIKPAEGAASGLLAGQTDYDEFNGAEEVCKVPDACQ